MKLGKFVALQTNEIASPSQGGQHPYLHVFATISWNCVHSAVSQDSIIHKFAPFTKFYKHFTENGYTNVSRQIFQ
jgi:hypothetical protein